MLAAMSRIASLNISQHHPSQCCTCVNDRRTGVNQCLSPHVFIASVNRHPVIRHLPGSIDTPRNLGPKRRS